MKPIKDYEIIHFDMCKQDLLTGLQKVIREANYRGAIPILDSVSNYKIQFTLFVEDYNHDRN